MGDAFGEKFFVKPSVGAEFVAKRELPRAPWFWTDDTAMGLSVYDTLEAHGRIDADDLAKRFGERYRHDPHRGYGGTAHDILGSIARGESWRESAGSAFHGQGSMGNGSAMRVAPIGGFFADDLDAVVANARASAEPTHAHPDGHAGAIAVAVAAALASQVGRGKASLAHEDFLKAVVQRTPDGPTRDGIYKAMSLIHIDDPRSAACALGNGSKVICEDTVPFSLWCASRWLEDFEGAMWATVSAEGDRDTTCAIVGGIVALRVGFEGIPSAWLKAREVLESGLSAFDRQGYMLH